MSFVSPATGREVQAVLFDTFGTVVDWRSGVARAVTEFTRRHGASLEAEAFADAWRGRYDPAMERVRSGHRGYVPLDELHLENLRATLTEFGLDPDAYAHGELRDLNAAWERLDPWPDSIEGLTELGRHVVTGPLSNANLALLLRMARRSGLPWTVIVGSDATRAYKPSPDAYLGMAAMLRYEPGEVMLAAAHNSDLRAAAAAGLATAFFPRPTEHGRGQTSDLAAEGPWDLVCDDLHDLASRFSA